LPSKGRLARATSADVKRRLSHNRDRAGLRARHSQRPGGATVPATFHDGLIFVTVEAGGAEGLFLLDTGAAATVLDPRLPDRRAWVR
jgi:hypothetical protein